ncbi:dephospho-CoA kinase [Bacteroidia bacterium]|nr:dephospho-CoA kinase [Bacteroidia bacterium]
MVRIGITGGIGSGKSVVSSLLEVVGIPVYIADTESKLLTNTSPMIRKQLTALLGDELFAGGELNKRRLASAIFNDPEMLKQVNGIIHPEVNRHFSDWVNRQTSKLCALESAILFESGFNRTVDVTVMVYAPLELRLTRVAARDGASIESIRSRINNQLPDETKMQKADYTIYNDDRQALIPQIQAFLNRLI